MLLINITKMSMLFSQIFVPDDVEPKTAHALRDAPKPTGKKGDVHPLRTHNAQAALLPGLANVRQLTI